MLSKLKLNLEKILTIGVYVALFVSLLYPYSDKDWGWHYRYGQYLLENGQLLIRDIYSWTLNGYAWINHSWLFDPILYILFNNFGYLGLSVSAALVAIIAFYLVTDGYNLKYWQLGICAFFFNKLTETGLREGLRSQVLAVLPLGLLIYVLNKGRNNPKWFSFIPPLFFIWANLHGTFAFGVAILGAFFTSYFFEFKEYRKKLVIIALITFIATLVNPFTYHSYLEVLRHTSSPYLQNVFEWLPIYVNCSDCHTTIFTTYLIILITAAIIKPKKSEIPFFLIVLGLTLQTISARRYMPLFLISTIPLLASFMTRIKNKDLNLSLYKLTPYVTGIVILITLEFNIFNRLPSFNYYHYTEKDYCYNTSRCSVDALNYLNLNPPKGNGFNFYDWGGYLIGKGFPAKVFIDGRMHLWQVKGYSPFGDYIKMYYNKDKDLFRKYDFDWVLVETGSEISKMIETGGVDVWRLTYHDDYTRYYTRIR